MRLLLIDFNNTVFRSVYVNQQLEWEGVSTGGLYGFLNQFCARINEYNPSHFVLAGDMKPYARTRFYKDYKNNRKKEELPDNVKRGVEQVKKLMLEGFGLPLVTVKGAEADDIIAWYIDAHHNKFKEIVVLSNDDDLFQLLYYDNVLLHKGQKLITKKVFETMYPTLKNPSEWVSLTALTGTHNNIKGLERVGEKTALKILRDPDRLKEVWEKNEELLERNNTLITLPFEHIERELNAELDSRPPSVINYNEYKVLDILRGFGIEITDSMSSAFSIIKSFKRK